MFDVYEYFDSCREAGMTGAEAMGAYIRDLAEYEADLIGELEERQLANAWQEDMIAMRRLEQ